MNTEQYVAGWVLQAQPQTWLLSGTAGDSCSLTCEGQGPAVLCFGYLIPNDR